MPALQKPYENFEKPGLVVSYQMAAVKIYKGSLVGVNAAGFLVQMAHGTAGLRFVGVANETADNSAGAAGDLSLNVNKTGTFVFKPVAGYTPAQGDLGKDIYANTDWEVQVSATGLTNAYKVGSVTRLETTSTGSAGVRIRIGNYTL